ncbi:MAG: hypothetical protein WBO55_12400 [Rhizobiaceae bacterium]
MNILAAGILLLMSAAIVLRTNHARSDPNALDVVAKLVLDTDMSKVADATDQ